MASDQDESDKANFPTHQRAGDKRTRVQECLSPRKSTRLEEPPSDWLPPTNNSQLRPQSPSRERPNITTHRSSTPGESVPRRPEPTDETTLVPPPPENLSQDQQHFIAYWAVNKQWPQKFLEEDPVMEHIVAHKRSLGSGLISSSASSTPRSSQYTDHKARVQKSAEYSMVQYPTLLAIKGVFMHDSRMGMSPESKQECAGLLQKEVSVPEHSLFDDDLFKITCRKLRGKNEMRVIQDIARLIVPSAETLHTYGATHLECLIESHDEGWNNSIPITKTRPQPDYAVGFCRDAFSQAQLDRMKPVVGDFMDRSYFMGTWYMYFPFLTCEVTSAADVADRRNAHSTAIAMRSVVELFRAVGREKELQREVLAFSLSHDQQSVRIDGHYVEIEGREIKYYSHAIHSFDITALDGKEKWTAYKFTKNVYDTWMPKHFKRICSAIDQIPDTISFAMPQSELHFSTPSAVPHSSNTTSEHAADDAQSIISPNPAATPGTSVQGGAAAKKPRTDQPQ